MAEGILTLNPISPERDPEELGRPSYIEAPVGAGIALALDKILNQETFGPDADQIEKERKEIRESLKPGVSPEIEPPKPESFPDQSEEINMPIITYSKDAPKDLKDLVKRSVGPEKGEKAVSKIYDDEIFNEVLEPEQLKRIMELESAFVGDLADLGDMAIPEIFENSFLAQNEDYMADYQAALESAAQKTLGNEFKTYRLMEKEDALRMLIDGQFPNVKRLQEDEEGNEFYGDIEIIGMDGEPTKLQKQAMSFTLSPKEAIQFRYRPAGGRDKLKDEDFVLIEYNASPSDIVMRGHEGEKELVLRLGETVGDKRVTPKVFKVYDAKFGEKNIELSENSQFKEFVDKSKTKEVKKARGGFILNTMPYMDKPLPGRSRDIQ